MQKFLTALACAGVLAGCSEKKQAEAPVAAAPIPARVAESPVPAPAVPTLSLDGMGALKFGMTLAQAEAALDEQSGSKATPDCSYVRFKALPDVQVMVENGIVTRADLKGTAPNVAGVNIGDDAAAVRKTYPDAEIAPHKYVQGGHTIKIVGPKKNALVFEDDGNKITGVRAGLEPAVSYVEGCS